MSIYGIRFVCDLCPATGEAAPPPPGPPLWSEMPAPDGWAKLDGLSLQLRDAYGAPIAHLCPACSRLPIGAIAARMMELAKEQNSAR